MKIFGLSGKLALVTGAGGGIGQAIVASLLKAGAQVIATDTDMEKLSLLKANKHLHLHKLDITNSQNVDSLIDHCESNIGPIDLGVNVAGIVSTCAITNTSDALWDQVFKVNVDGVFYISRALARVMKPRKRGNIVTVSSNAASIPRYNMAAYAASKAAVTMFSRCLGLELASHGIRCNVVAPGSTLTPMQTEMWTDTIGEDEIISGTLETYRTGIPLKKLASPEDIAHSVLFLLSDLASHITMADLFIDGGATLKG